MLVLLKLRPVSPFDNKQGVKFILDRSSCNTRQPVHFGIFGTVLVVLFNVDGLLIWYSAVIPFDTMIVICYTVKYRESI
jgi:hypothetical protein